jgi:hypothetical protein
MLLVPVAASLALLAGCATGGATPEASPTPSTNGVDALDAEGILDAGVGALTDAKSFRLSGDLAGAVPDNLTVDVVYAGDDAQGTVNYLGVDVDLIKIGDEVFLKADASLFGAYITDPSLLDQVNDKWVMAPISLVSGFVPLPLTAADWFTDDKVARPLTKGEVTELNGTPVVTITDAEDSVYSIALEGEPYILQITTPGGPVTFSDFDKSVVIEGPDGAIDLMALFGLG